MEFASKSKKLKQARLSFGQVQKLVEEKENIISLDTHDKSSLKKENETFSPISNEGVVFTSILRQKSINVLNENQIEVKVDVHQTIQCPEVSTSSMESEAEKSFTTIDLTEENQEDNGDENSPEITIKITEEASNNLDAVIDSVIERGLNDADGLFSSINNARERRKRHARSPSTGNKSKISLTNSDDQVKTDTTTPKKKPRRSILDMLSVSVKEPQDSNTKTDTAKQNSIKKMTAVVLSENLEMNKDRSNRATTPTIKVSDDGEETSGHSTNGFNTVCSDSKKETESSSLPHDCNVEYMLTEVVDTIDLCMDVQKKMPKSEEKTENSQTCENDVIKKSPNPKKISRKSSEMTKVKEEKEKEKRKAKEEEKRLREKEKLEMKRKKEEERLQREEEKRRKKEEADKLKDEKQKKRQEELEKKKTELEAKKIEKEKREEEKRRERELKDAEKRAKDEEKAKMEEEKKKKAEKQASSFKSFFTPPPKHPPPRKFVEKSIGSFVPFQLKEDMFLSPRPAKLNQEAKITLEENFEQQKHAAPSYLKELKLGAAKRCRSRTISRPKPKLLSLSDDGLEILSSAQSSNSVCLRAKLLQFSENVRPPYYGTWKKKSKNLNPRSPFRKDEDLLDYDVDSEAEWEDVGEGEDIAQSDGEEEGGGAEDDEEEADGFFVPHGYLSDDEGINEDEEDDVNEDRSDQKLKMKQQEFENSFKQKIKILVPQIIGCLWEREEKERSWSNHVIQLQKYEAQFFISGPIDLEEKLLPSEVKSESKTSSTNKKGVPEEDNDSSNQNAPCNPSPENSPNKSLTVTSATPSPSCSPFLVSGVLEKSPFFISKTQLLKKVKEIGIYARKENLTRSCWLVLDSVFEKYSIDPSLHPIPCKWDYVTFEPDLKIYPSEIIPVSVEPKVVEPPVKGIIHKFATKVSAASLLEKSKLKLDQEKEKQTASALVLEKFTTTKITPEKLLETSRQKSERDEMKQKRRINLTSISLGADKDSVPSTVLGTPDSNDETSTGNPGFGVPTHNAFKSFFNVKEQVDAQSIDQTKSVVVNKSDDVIAMEVCSEEINDNEKDSCDKAVENMETET